MMQSRKRRKLEARGWRVGNAADFLGLSGEEAAFVELKLKLANRLKATRLKQHLSQEALAKRLNSSQSRVAKMESGDRSVSIDLLVKSLIELGVSNKEIGKTIADSRAA
jgi:ribosome-binding protein aMBF1 (putative translation factor)